MGNACSHLPIISRSLRRSNATEHSNRMDSLPSELLMNILSRVPTADLLQQSFVCRRWRNILNDPHFHQLHLSHSMSNPNENRVLVLKTESKLHLVDFAKKNGKSPRQIAVDLPRVPGIESYSFIGSCNGLLCLGSTQRHRIIVINPITSQPVLFSIHLNVAVISWGFGFDESSKIFKVIIMTMCPYTIKLAVSVCDLGSDGNTNWRSKGVTPYDAGRLVLSEEHVAIVYDASRTVACFLNGRLHWAYYDVFSIISFDLADEEFRRIPAPNGLVDATNSYLITLRRCLGIVHFRSYRTQNLQIWVMKEYGVEASWVKEIDIRPLLPRTLNVNNFWRFSKALGSVKDSELVLLDKEGKEPAILVSANSRCSKFKRLKLKEIPTPCYDSVVHTASLNLGMSKTLLWTLM